MYGSDGPGDGSGGPGGGSGVLLPGVRHVRKVRKDFTVKLLSREPLVENHRL